MHNERYREDNKEILKNADIKTDIRKRVVSNLIVNTAVVLWAALACFVDSQLIRLASKEQFLFWIAIILFFSTLILGITFVVGSIKSIIWYITVVLRNRFYVTTETLTGKKQGRSALAFFILWNLGLSILSLFYFPKPNRYCFDTDTYKVWVGKAHFRHSKMAATNGTTLFRRSDIGDTFLLVSLKPGKPIAIYPTDLFDYKDSSPL